MIKKIIQNTNNNILFCGYEYNKILKTLYDNFSQTKSCVLIFKVDDLSVKVQIEIRYVLEHNKSLRFFLFCENEWKVIEGLRSRCSIVKFKGDKIENN